MSSEAPTSSSSVPRAIGILAGGGSLPREIAQSIIAQGRRVHIVTIAGEGGDGFAPLPATVVGWGQIGAMIRSLKDAGCDELVIVGSVKRPDLWALRTDWGFWRNIPTILRIVAAGGDDDVLTRVVRFFEGKGFRVVAPWWVAPELLLRSGPLGTVQAMEQDRRDVALGFSLVRALGPYDVGQAVVVADGSVLAIEGIEGTDAMLARVAKTRGAGDARAGLLVKRPKPGQELRIDLPAIGPDTVRAASAARLRGIAVLAGGVLAAQRSELLRLADAEGLLVQGFEDKGAPAGTVPRPPEPKAAGQRRLTQRQQADCRRGAAVLAALAPLCASRGVILDGRHVLAIESGEGIDALLTRTAGLRQWGRRAWSGRSGTIVLADAGDIDAALWRAVEAGLAGIAVVGQHPAALSRARIDADRLGLFLAALTPGAGTP